MFETIASVATQPEDLTSRGLLARARASSVAAQRAEADVLAVAYEWAIAHPADEPGTGAAFRSGPMSDFEPIAGEGCPEVDEYAPAELGAVLGLSTTAAKRLIGHALELRCRLPRLWAGIESGTVLVWRARAVAEATIHAHPTLTLEAAHWVDAQVAAVAGKVGPAQLDRVVAEAIKRHQLATANPMDDPEDGWVHVDPRHVTFDDEMHFAGTMRVTAELDIADALDLEHAVRAGAAEFKALGSDGTLDARRSMALGALARQQTTLSLTDPGPDQPDQQGTPVETIARRLDLHIHLTANTGQCAGPGAGPGDGSGVAGPGWVFGPTATLEQGHRLALLHQVKDWCRDTGTEVRILPVIDLNEEITCPGYTPSPRLRRQVQLRDRTCVFPWCNRPARACDLDHIDPYNPDTDGTGPPQTRTSNLASLCRHHHRLKTHTAWRYTSPTNGVFEWTSPHGHRYRRDRHGTTRIDPPDD